ncbi:MAG: polysaccharide deacetylase family protein [Hyphomicrobiaceae bacterium]
MRAALFTGLAGLLVTAAVWAGAQAQAPASCQAGPDALGVSRTLDVDAAQGPRFGNNQYSDRYILREGEVILTFDDGPHPVYTRTVLEALEAHCTRATFFMVGFRAFGQSALVREMARRGHTIATHTWSHQDLAKLDPVAAKGEIELGISAVQRALGAPAAPFFRFPYLSDPSAMRAHLKARNTGIFSIDVDAYDYRTRSPTAVVRNVMLQLESKRKGIILFHDIQASTAGAIKTMLAELKARGYKVVHLRPTQGQVTVAEYDTRIDRDYANRKIAYLPVAQRGVFSSAWEASVAPNTPSNINGVGLTPSASGRATQRAAEDDWRRGIFSGR